MILLIECYGSRFISLRELHIKNADNNCCQFGIEIFSALLCSFSCCFFIFATPPTRPRAYHSKLIDYDCVMQAEQKVKVLPTRAHSRCNRYRYSNLLLKICKLFVILFWLHFRMTTDKDIIVLLQKVRLNNGSSRRHSNLQWHHAWKKVWFSHVFTFFFDHGQGHELSRLRW